MERHEEKHPRNNPTRQKENRGELLSSHPQIGGGDEKSPDRFQPCDGRRGERCKMAAKREGGRGSGRLPLPRRPLSLSLSLSLSVAWFSTHCASCSGDSLTAGRGAPIYRGVGGEGETRRHAGTSSGGTHHSTRGVSAGKGDGWWVWPRALSPLSSTPQDGMRRTSAVPPYERTVLISFEIVLFGDFLYGPLSFQISV